jgi:CRISPR-associated protein Csx10
VKLWHVTITARSPLVFPVRKPGAQFRASLPYVPGAVLYGALGEVLARTRRFDPQLMQTLRCHNAYPGAPGDRWVRPLPLTAASPKGAERPADTLADRVCWEALRPAALIYAPTGEDGRAWEACSGFYASPHADDLRQQIARSVTQRVMTRVSINRRRGTAEDQRLYSFLAISEVNTFTRYHWNEQDDEASAAESFATLFLGSAVSRNADDLAPLLAQIQHIGGRITTGLGEVAVQAQETTPEDGQVIKRRIAQMTERFRASAARYARLRPTRDWQPDGAVFTVNLLSDAILYEDGWRPTTTLTAEMLREASGIQAELRLLRSFAQPEIAGGWNVVWPGPKPTEVSTQRGAVFVFQASHGLTDDDYQRLADLQLDGIGERRAEGYGQVRICDEFHLDDRYQLEYRQFLEEQP